jgi:flagellar basal-body rod protein FlgB
MARALIRLARLLHYDTAQTNFSRFPAMIDRLEQDLNFTRTALGVRGYRQELLASNIANADTPNFKARDIDFKSALGVALGNAGADAAAPLAMTRTRAGHQAGAADTPYGAATQYRTEYQGAVDGNTVNMDVERAAFAENALQVEALITFINNRFSTLNAAIRGQ